MSLIPDEAKPVELCYPKEHLKVPKGFSDQKGQDDYFLDAVRNFWAETGLDIDDIGLRVVVNYFDKARSKRND